jgi:4-amino-4-deoxy-L-arabinose transferase-like glycosyltransferase
VSRFVPALTLLVIAAVLLRVLHLLAQSRALPFLEHPMMDAALYDQWARAIASGRSFGGNEPFYHSPGYAYFLGAMYRMVGPRPIPAILVQNVLGVGTIVLTALLGRRLFGPGRGILAGVFVLGSAPFYFYEVKLLDATLSVFVATLAITLAVLPDQKRTAFLAGVMGGLLGVIRANLLVVPIWIVIISAIEARARQRAWLTVGAYAAGTLIVLLPPFVHNLQRGALVPVATQGGFNFYLGNARGATGVFTDFPGTTGIIATQEAEADSLVKLDLGHVLPPGPESQYWFGRTLREIAADPGHWVRLLAKKAWLYGNRQEEEVNGSLELEKDRVWLLRAAAVPFNLLWILGVLGGVLAFLGHRRGDDRAWGRMAIPAVLVAATFLTCILFFVLTRLRLPAVPVLAIFSAFALTETWSIWRRGRRGVVLVGSLAVLGAAVLTWRSPLGVPRNPAWEASLVVEGAKALAKKGDAARAAAMYRVASEIDPRSVAALLGEAEEAVQAGDVSRTIALYERARDVAPEQYAIRNNLGILYFRTGRFPESEHEMEEASRLEPRAAAPFLYRGLAAQAIGDPRAEELFVGAVERDPRLREAYTALIGLLTRSGQTGAAREWEAKARAAGVDVSGN